MPCGDQCDECRAYECADDARGLSHECPAMREKVNDLDGLKEKGVVEITYHDNGAESPYELRPPFSVERPEGSGNFMRLYDDARKLVAYLGIPKAGNQRDLKTIVGTGFLLEHDNTIYLVTAGHVAQLLEDRPVGIRLNDRENQARVLTFNEIKWWFHPDPTVDVAATEFRTPEWADVSPWHTKWMVTLFKRETKNIGAGDMVHIVGAFKFLPGTKRNMPTVHTGHIALMADDEPIPVKHWKTEGYLIEAQTLDTLSGSPVLVRRSLPAKMKIPELDSNALNVWLHGSMWMLGLWHGAWYGKPKEKGRVPGKDVRIPAGMGICVPAIKIIDVLERPELKTKRTNAKAAEAARVVPELQSAELASAGGEDMLI